MDVSWTISLSGRGEQFFDPGSKRAEAGFDHAPYQAVVHAGITVNQDIAKGDDARKIGNPAGSVGIDATQPIQGFTDNLELALDSGPEESSFP